MNMNDRCMNKGTSRISSTLKLKKKKNTDSFVNLECHNKFKPPILCLQ